MSVKLIFGGQVADVFEGGILGGCWNAAFGVTR